MASRLDRLVLLLDTGSTTHIRHTAASQLGDIAKQKPEETYHLLARVVGHLRSKAWDTRTAAGVAIEKILQGVEESDPWVPPRQEKNPDPSILSVNTSSDQTNLPELYSFSTFSLLTVLQNGRKLLGSAGKEYDVQDLSDLDPAQRLAAQKKNLTARLGMGSQFMDMDGLMGDDDVSAAPVAKSPTPMTPTTTDSAYNMDNLSARERNMLKRKQKKGSKAEVSKVRVVDIGRRPSVASPLTPTPSAVKLNGKENDKGYFSITEQPQQENKIVIESKVGKSAPGDENSDAAGETADENIYDASTQTEWPFANLADLLLTELFDPQWECRHGAGIGLRALFKVAGKYAGMTTVPIDSSKSNEQLHQEWLEDAVIRVLCVFALDRFGDFVSDTVVAPVRETVAQVLGVASTLMSSDLAIKCIQQLENMVEQQSSILQGLDDRVRDHLTNGRSIIWELRHAGLLGLKYLVAARRDLMVVKTEQGRGLLSGVVDTVVLGLRDKDDDVRAAAAATLIPVVDELVNGLSAEDSLSDDVTRVMAALWASLKDLKDDLTASTAVVMDLLKELVSKDKVIKLLTGKDNPATLALGRLIKQEEALAALDDEFDNVILSDEEEDESNGTSKDLITTLTPRLYPFFRHTISSVRMAVLNALLTFLSGDVSIKHAWLSDPHIWQLVFQNIIVEQNQSVRDMSSQLWTAMVSASDSTPAIINAQLLQDWTSLVMTPWHMRLDADLFFVPKGGVAAAAFAAAKKVNGKKRKASTVEAAPPSVQGYNIDAAVISQDASLVGQETLLRCKVAGATALGRIMTLWSKDGDLCFNILSPYLSSPVGLQKQVSAIIVEEWALASTPSPKLSSRLSDVLIPGLEASTTWTYSEMSPILHRVKAECQGLLSALSSEGRIEAARIPAVPLVLQDEPAATTMPAGSAFFTLETASYVAQTLFEELIGSVQARGGPPSRGRGRGRGGSDSNGAHIDPKTSLQDRQHRLIGVIGYYAATKEQIDLQAQSAYSAAVIALGRLPAKLNPVIRSTMNAIKGEQDVELQRRAAKALARLIRILADQQKKTGKAGPNDKVVKNLCAFLCQDTSTTPIFAEHKNLYDMILSLQRDIAAPVTTAKGRGRKPAATATDAASAAASALADAGGNKATEADDKSKVIRRGAEMALAQLATDFGLDVFDLIPQLWQSMTTALGIFGGKDNVAKADQLIATDSGQPVIDALTLLTTLVPHLHPRLHTYIIDTLPAVMQATRSTFTVVRYTAAHAIAAVCDVITSEGLQMVIRDVIPMLGDVKTVAHRQGAAEVIYRLVQKMDFNILPYVIFLIVPILARMSDTNEPVRLIATNTFASLIKLVPLESGVPDPPGMSEEMLQKRDSERKFLMQLLDSSKLEPFQIPIKIKAELRKYQQDGVNWLAFLNKYHLHGVLCDDMGLGKTLQSICILSSDHHLRRERFASTGAPDAAHIPSLVVCPPTLTGHWYHEILNYTDVLQPMVYTGHPVERRRLQGLIPKHDVVITSYDIIRNDVAELSPIDWNYCILDEGHMIKNAKTKITQSVKMMRANHRLILSGTPIQNNVLELWSLFDFLMPGFLGTEKMFNERFGKPILASRDAKSSSRDQEAGALALEALHKQVLPFLLRRLKEDVLGDLPPKIIQDYYCDLSDLQKSLYEDFAKTQALSSVEEDLDVPDGEKKKPTHVFQALQYLRKLVNHPLLVVNPSHPEFNAVTAKLAKSNSNLHDVVHAPKLQALRQLLTDCGIGTDTPAVGDSEEIGAVSQHRVLIFCQMKQMLDIIENDLFKQLMPSVTYMRMDGGTDATKRHGIVQKFNMDPSIDVLLLTTHVGGLGLNLTGADTVIFMEHDWNPSKDLQAMDRAHRIGQKKVVNVYRLITRNTLEEKIMGLQKFKTNIANSVVNQQNSGLSSMDTDQILDLFNVGEEKPKETKKEEKATTKNVLEGLGDLWDSNQYEEEYNLDSFMETLKR